MSFRSQPKSVLARALEEAQKDTSVSGEAQPSTYIENRLNRITANNRFIELGGHGKDPKDLDQSAIAPLLQQLEAMLARSASQENARMIEVDRWLRQWLHQPWPALDWQRPVDLLGTSDGLSLVSAILAEISAPSATLATKAGATSG